MPAESASVQVAVRVRPLNTRERTSDKIVTVENTTTGPGTIILNSDKKHKFTFDYAYDSSSTSGDIYNSVGKLVVANARNGYNCCVFAYGQTGCFARDTPIRMYDGTVRNVQDIIPDDIVMGDDCTPRTVLNLFYGIQPSFLIKSYYNDLPNYTVNADHMMVIVENGHIVEKPVSKCLRFSTGLYRKNNLLLLYPIEIIPQATCEYFGFLLDGNHRFQHASGIILRNSGKSHTMMGNNESPGIIPRVCKELLEQRISLHTYSTSVSYIEIYSEKITDLLSGATSLAIREHPTNGPYVESLRQVIVYNFADVKKLIESGNTARKTCATLMNAHSSRSHAILTIYFTQIIEDSVKSREIRSKINLVDLAGSERMELSGVTGVAAAEAISINKSLSTLGLVIGKLSKKDGHIPFRDSTLTWLLKESLGGNSLTYMIATISPSSLNYQDTLSTLRYAASAKQIINKVSINEDPADALVRKLLAEIEELKAKLRIGENSATIVADIHAHEEEIARINAIWEERTSTVSDKLQNAQYALAASSDELVAAKTSILSITTQLDTSRAEVESLSTQLAASNEMNCMLNDEVTKLDVKLQEAITSVNNLNITLDKLQSEHVDEINKLQSEHVDEIKRVIKETRDEHADAILMKKIQQYSAALDEAKAEISKVTKLHTHTHHAIAVQIEQIAKTKRYSELMDLYKSLVN